MSAKVLKEMFGIVGLPAINRIKEDDDIARVNRQFSNAQSVAGTRTGTPGRTPRDLEKVQGQLDTARSVFKKEAATGANGITLNGDRETLGALMECLQEAEHAAGDPDLSTWAGRAWKAVAAGIRGNGSVTLPKFEQAPEELMPDEEPTEGDF